MKRFGIRYGICISIIALMVAAPISLLAESAKKTEVFLLAGQSNMNGLGKVENLPEPYKRDFEKVKVWDSEDKKWVPLSPGVVNKDGKTFGPELSFGHAITEVLPGDDIRLVKFAVNGTALYNDWAPKEGPQYKGFMRTAKAALADLDAAKADYEIAGMLWLQGESDALEHKAETYEKNLTAFIDHMRTEFKTPDMPFIIARVCTHYGGKSGQAQIVREAQVKIAEEDENVAWFDTDDCEPVIYGHYNARGQVKIGNRFAEKYKDIRGKDKSDNGTSMK